MLLIRFNVWFGPSRHAKATNEGQIAQRVDLEAYATRLSLSEAIRRVRAYEEAFRIRYREVSAVVFSLIGVDEIDNLDDATLEIARVRLIESLPMDPEQIGL